jgi:hypothetical protein
LQRYLAAAPFYTPRMPQSGQEMSVRNGLPEGRINLTLRRVRPA